MEISDQFKALVVTHLGVAPDEVTDNASFVDNLGADSLDEVELLMAAEEDFDVEIPDDVAETLTTVGDAVRWLQANTRA